MVYGLLWRLLEIHAHDAAEVDDLLVLVGADHGLLIAHDLALTHGLNATELWVLLLRAIEEELLIGADLLPAVTIS